MSFKRIGAFTDIHFGKKSDSETHNRDCLDYLTWFCDQAVKRKVDRLICMGDWFDNRSRIRLDSNWYSREGFDIIGKTGIPMWFIIGNHDMYYKHNRTVHSHAFLDLYPGVEVINQITQVGDVLLCPYLTGTEFSDPPSYDCKYVFGHFEFPTYLTNEWYEFEDKGLGLHADMFTNPEWVFSGHFHKRQIKRNANDVNICYIGNTFPMDYNDTNDRQRGAMFLDHGGEPEFVDWTDGPSYSRVGIDEVINLISDDKFEERFNKRSNIECTDDLGLEDDELVQIREYAQSQVRDFIFKPKPTTQIDQDVEVELKGNLDDIVIEGIRNLQVAGTRINTGILESLYKGVQGAT